MRESNFSNAAQNKACVCISAAVYDRRAIDCTASLPLINSLNHLAYLTSTSPRIREMVTLDGGLERLIRILRQVPKSPSASSLRVGTTKEMQAVWKWSLAFQCVVNVGVRGSETVRTRVVEAGMVPITVRVLESYLRSSEATRADERRKEHREHRGQREARREEQRERDNAMTSLARSVARRGAVSVAPTPNTQLILAAAPVTPTNVAAPVAPARGSATTPTTTDSLVRSNGLSATRGGFESEGTRPITPAEADAAVMLDATSRSYMPASSSRPQRSARRSRESPSEAAVPVVRHRSGAVVMPILPDLTVMPMDSDDAASLHASVSPSTSASSTMPTVSEDVIRSASPANVIVDAREARSGTLTNVSSVEDFGTSGSEGLDESEMFAADDGEESEMDGLVGPTASPDATAAEDLEERQTPRPTRRALAPLSTAAEPALRGIPAWNANAAQASNVAYGGSASERHYTVAVTVQGSSTSRTPAAAAATTPREARPLLWPQQGTSRPHGSRHAPAALASMPTVVPPTPIAAAPSTPAAATGGGDMIYREEEVLLSLQLLAYLSKYSHVRVLFHSSELSGQSLSGSLAELTDLMYPGSSSLTSPASVQLPQQPQQSWDPTLPSKKNVFSIAERYTHKSSRPGSSQASVHLKLAPEIQYWAGVIMRNACRKDEARGGIRQCANMLCGKWESFPREFAKCRRCRKAKYCSKQCQSKGWSLGHRFWCSSRVDESEKDNKQGTSDANEIMTGEAATLGGAATAVTPPEASVAAGGERSALEQAATQARVHRHHHHRPTQTTAQDAVNARATASGSGTRDRSSTATASTSRRSRPSAIPEHVSANASPAGSRPVSRGSSGGETSDVSDDEMERASRRVAASTLALPEGSPLAMHAALAAEDLEGNAPPPPPQRTDLAGRPLPPPVIAQHDPAAVDADLLSLGGRYTPGANEANDAQAVFGRGDFDQMIWRGHTPAPGDDEDDSAASLPQQHALEELEQATPLQPQPGPSALRAPIARQAHRFASAAVGTAGASGDLSLSLRNAPVGGATSNSSSGALPTTSAGLGFAAHLAAHPYGGLEGRRAPSHHATSFMPRSTSGLASAPAFSQSFPSLVQQTTSMPHAAPSHEASSSSSSSAYPMEDEAVHFFSLDDDEDESMCEAHETEHTHDFEALWRSAASLEQHGEGSFILPDDVMEPYQSAYSLPEEVMLQLVYLYIYMYALAQAFPDLDVLTTPATGTPFDEETFDEAEFVDASAGADLMDFEMR